MPFDSFLSLRLALGTTGTELVIDIPQENYLGVNKVNWNVNTATATTKNNATGLIGSHPAFLQSKSLVEKAGGLRILFYGETGAGKTPFARYSNEVMNQTQGSNRPFEQLNCACLNPEHFQDLLFGHKKGAFTGAIADKKGLVELADGGDLFLDEIGDMPISTQAHFLTFMDSLEYYRLGDDRKRRANIRVICATNRDLKKMVEEGTFRRDLYSRISQMIIPIPALRERRSDIAALVQFFIQTFCGYQKPFESEVMNILTNHSWVEGNVRELKDAVEYLCLVGKNDAMLRVNHLGDRFMKGEMGVGDSVSFLNEPPRSIEAVYQIGLDAYMERLEKHLLEKLLEVNDGCMEKLARQLKTSRSTLYRKLKKYEEAVTGSPAMAS